MNNDINIRIAKEKDISQLCKVQKETWIDTYPNGEYGITVEDILTKDFDSGKKIELLKEQFRNKKLRVWVALDGEKIVGFSRAKKAELKNDFSVIYILPQYQRMGIGKQLANAVFEWLRESKTIVVEVVKYNNKAISFYKKLGFGSPEEVKLPLVLLNNKVLPTIRMIRNN